MKTNIKNILKSVIFILIIILPFLSITQIISVDIFIDSFENPEHYICLSNKENFIDIGSKDPEYILIQKSSHPEFSIKKFDIVIYCDNNGKIACNEVNCNYIGAVKSYNIINENKISQKIYEPQIIGKVINAIEDNIWNSISIKIWETSINSINIRSLFTSN